jgi:hypothetical protein
MTDTAQEENVHRFNDTVTLVGETYCVSMRGRYVTAIGRADDRLSVGVHMTQDEARALLAGLQEALGG